MPTALLLEGSIVWLALLHVLSLVSEHSGFVENIR